MFEKSEEKLRDLVTIELPQIASFVLSGLCSGRLILEWKTFNFKETRSKNINM